MDNNPANLSIEAISRLKWVGIEETSLNALEDRQRMRIKAFRERLEIEEQELTWIMAARSSSATKAEDHHGTVHAPICYSDKMTWKDKIILAVAEAKRPLLAREIIPVLKSWEPMERHKDIDSLVSVLLSQLVRDGALVRTKRKGQSGALHGLPG
jgi:hypothetical protein